MIEQDEREARLYLLPSIPVSGHGERRKCVTKNEGNVGGRAFAPYFGRFVLGGSC